MTNSHNDLPELNDTDLGTVTGGSLAMKMEVLEVVKDSYDRTGKFAKPRLDGEAR